MIPPSVQDASIAIASIAQMIAVSAPSTLQSSACIWPPETAELNATYTASMIAVRSSSVSSGFLRTAHAPSQFWAN